MPAQRIENQAANGRARPQTDRLGRRLQTERPTALLGVGRQHDDGDAVGRNQRRPCSLENAEDHQRRQVRREAAQGRPQDEDEEAAGIEQLAADHVRQPSEDRHARRHRQQIGDGDPAHRAQPGVEVALEPGQQHLRHAGIDLTHEGADADRADDEPAIGFEPRDGRQRRWLVTFQDGPPQGRDRERAWRLVSHDRPPASCPRNEIAAAGSALTSGTPLPSCN